MAKGGARARSGPAPDPNALRRERDGEDWLTLPATGRKGKPPTWPLSAPTVLIDGESVMLEERRVRELALWGREWRRPQAVMWERLGQEIEVALYVRCLVTVEQPDASSSLIAQVRLMQEALGLSLPGLARNKWRIGTVATVATSEAGPAGPPSVRDRLKLVAGDG